jgi:hypothetical protein
MVEAVLQCCAIWQDDSNPAAISSFSKNVAHAAHRKDQAGFLDAMKQSVGSVMQEEEIRVGLARYMQMEHTEDIVHELKIRSSNICRRCHKPKVFVHTRKGCWFAIYRYCHFLSCYQFA